MKTDLRRPGTPSRGPASAVLAHPSTNGLAPVLGADPRSGAPGHRMPRPHSESLIPRPNNALVPEQSSSFADLAAFAALPRVTGLALSPDGARLVATVDQPDPDRAKYVSSIWDVDPQGRRPAARLTWSEKGEGSPAFLPDGTLLFVSSRGEDEDAALWSLPAGGEARVLARNPGGVGGPIVAPASGTVLVTASR